MNSPLFIANLALTVVLLGLTIHAGLTHRRRRHYVLVALTVTALAAAIVQAELYGRGFRFEPWRLGVHLACAFSALATLPGVAWSGLGLARARVRRVVHRRWVSAFVTLALLAIATAGFMFLNARRLA
ncbi:MAG: hypothetical protein EYC70_11975 [Planctomycetota bacterium]|nr:MAG: hypothetical protein EYC70_11975 [Planctomycetota bacterium]